MIDLLNGSIAKRFFDRKRPLFVLDFYEGFLLAVIAPYRIWPTPSTVEIQNWSLHCDFFPILFSPQLDICLSSGGVPHTNPQIRCRKPGNSHARYFAGYLERVYLSPSGLSVIHEKKRGHYEPICTERFLAKTIPNMEGSCRGWLWSCDIHSPYFAAHLCH